MAAKRARIEPVLWTRDDIVCCNCSELKSRHVHCPCLYCNGAAVARSVEYLHWQEQQVLNSHDDHDNVVLGNSGSVETPVEADTFTSLNSVEAASSTSPDSLEADSSLLEDDTSPDHDSIEADAQTDPDIEITIAILKALNLVDQMNGSVSDFEDILQFSRELFCRNDNTLEEKWPRNWQETQTVLKKCGFKAPRELYICLDESHYAQWDVLETADETCRHCGKAGKIKYYYLGISDKVELWCANHDMCKKMMAHWREKDHWIEGEGANFTLKEIWDGQRFNELSWFWKPDSEWMLPVKCKFCTNIISVDEIKEFPQEEEQYEITCPDCGTRWTQIPSYATGDPRNIALIGHWDGWQPFGYPGAHSCGAIEVTIANMAKAERCCTDHIYVVGFVPSYQLPKSRPCSLDPFLHPLISDIEDIFIDGLEVDYVESFPGLPAGRIILRILILLWTGDYPAQHEVGKYIKHGILPCRRDKLKGTINPEGGSTYYYVNNRYHARFGWEERKLEEDLTTMKDINEEDRKTVRAEKSKNSGYTGLSILYRLHKLYGFDIFKDLVYDTMHNLPSNVIAAQLKSFIALEKIDSKLVDQRLRVFPWTAELKDGRIPNGYGSRLNFWKAEELHKFAFPASEVIFADLLEDMDYHIWQLTVRMTELVFCNRDGWTFDDVQLFFKLAQRYLVLTEEHRGLTACTVTEHNLLHIPDDAMRFSHPDNYWCFPFERAVRRYVTTKSNFKNIECTYAKKEARRELLQRLSSSIRKQPKQYKFCLEKSKTFTLVCNPHETIARARAQMLHILFELGRAEHQFRFRFKGEYLRDGYTFEDYRILDNSVIKMVPMSKRKRGSYATTFGPEQSNTDMAASDVHVFSSRANLLGQEELDDVQKALRKEITIFERRETLLGNFKVLLWIHFLATVLAFTTTYWFSSFWTGALMLFGFIYCPNYTRLGGFVGKHGMNKNNFVIAFALGAIMNVTASLLMGIYITFELLAYECDNEEETCLRRKEQMYWSIIFYLGQAFFLVCSVLICALLFYNFKTEVGDLIETYLVQIRDIDKVMKSAKTGSVKDRRSAAFELASLAATGDDTKYRIVQEGGLEALMNLCLSQDQATQEYAIEAISELLTVPVIQDQFVDLGGVRTMCALLHSKENRVVNEAVTALSYIVSDSEANREVVIGENGLDDLCYVAERIQIPASRIVAAIFLELAFTAEIRVMLSQESAPASSLVHLCKLRDSETQRLALQTLELLAIENSDVIITHDSLLELLLNLPNLTDDEQLFLLAGKIILYYAENELACQKLVEAENLKFCLMELAYSLDPLLQNVVAKIVLAMIESHENKDEIAELGLDEVLIHIRNESTDRDAWRMADHGLMILHNVKPVGKRASESSGGKSSTSAGETLTTDLPIKKAL